MIVDLKTHIVLQAESAHRTTRIASFASRLTSPGHMYVFVSKPKTLMCTATRGW